MAALSTTLPFSSAPRRRSRTPELAALLLSLLVHAGLIWFLVLVWLGQPPQTEKPPVRIEYLGGQSLETPPPEELEALADVTRRASSDRVGMEEARHSTPTPELTAPLEPVEGPARLADPMTEEARKKKKASVTPMTVENSRREIPAATLEILEEPVESPDEELVLGGPPLALKITPMLGEAGEWDANREFRERRTMRQNGEATVDMNTREVRYASYFKGLKSQVKRTWSYPRAAKRAGVSGTLHARFTIDRAGRVAEIEILRSSGHEILDDSAIQAIRKAGPFPPLPPEWQLDRLHVTTTFEYLMR